MKMVPSAPGSAILSISSPKIVLLLVMSLFSVACGNRRSEPAENLSQYEVKGFVRGLPPGHQAVEIEHEDIPGFMPSMTMPFLVREEKELTNLQNGDAISFRLNVTQRDSWIDRVRKIDPGALHLPSAAPPPSVAETSERWREGDLMPDFRLLDQDAKPITQENFRGRPLILTFIFTRCAIPNYCPLMSRNFAALQNAIESNPGALNQAQLLSISFDSFDKPEILKAYAESEHADPKIWTYATGSEAEIGKLTHGFSVLVQREGGTISHGLATALVDRQGKILKIWRGNGWTPSEVMAALAVESQ